MSVSLHGLLVLDKPSGITSRDAVNRIQKLLPRGTRIGHTGTLDPLATGVLVLCIGNATRLAEYVQAMDKEYRTTILLGSRSDSDDADGNTTATLGIRPVAENRVREAILQFIGLIEQKPPTYSAIKIDGKRAHAMARRGESVEITARSVHVYEAELCRYEWPELDLRIHCGKGTYIRSIARDLGDELGCGAYVKTLRRTRVGSFRAEDATLLDELSATPVLLPSRSALGTMSMIKADDDTVARLRQGQAFKVSSEIVGVGTEVAVIDAHENLVSIGSIDQKGLFRPAKVFPAEI